MLLSLVSLALVLLLVSVCCDTAQAKYHFVATKHVFCRNKHVYVATKVVTVPFIANDKLQP